MRHQLLLTAVICVLSVFCCYIFLLPTHVLKHFLQLQLGLIKYPPIVLFSCAIGPDSFQFCKAYAWNCLF